MILVACGPVLVAKLLARVGDRLTDFLPAIGHGPTMSCVGCHGRCHGGPVTVCVGRTRSSTIEAMTDSGVGPLDGLQILDVSTYVAGPSGAMTLAQLGADVIRVDPVGGATDTRRLPLDPHGNSLYWASLNKAKKSIEINTRSEEGRELFYGLLAASGPRRRDRPDQRCRPTVVVLRPSAASGAVT